VNSLRGEAATRRSGFALLDESAPRIPRLRDRKRRKDVGLAMLRTGDRVPKPQRATKSPSLFNQTPFYIRFGGQLAYRLHLFSLRCRTGGSRHVKRPASFTSISLAQDKPPKNPPFTHGT